MSTVAVTVERALVARIAALEAELASAVAERKKAEDSFIRIASENVALERYVDVVREALMRLRPMIRNQRWDDLRESVAALVKMHPEHWGPRPTQHATPHEAPDAAF